MSRECSRSVLGKVGGVKLISYIAEVLLILEGML